MSNRNFNNIAQLIAETWHTQGGDNAIFDDANGNVFTRAEFLRLVLRRQLQLRGQFVAGDNILVSASRGVCYFVDLFVVWSIGAVAIPYAFNADASYITSISTISGAKINLNDSFPLDLSTINDQSDTSIYFSKTSNRAPCSILFTSGSTGIPKGVVLSHYSLVNNSLGILEYLHMNGSRLFVNVPFHFTSCICHFLACSLSASTLVGVEEKLLFGDLAKRVSCAAATGFGGAPIQLRWICDYVKATGNSLSSLRFVISSGDHLTADIIEDVLLLLPEAKLFTVYGLTELGGRFCVLDPAFIRTHTGSVGKPIKGLSIKVFNQELDQELPQGEEGELVAYGNLLASGYYNNPEATSKAFFDYGFRTGDIGYIDKEGFIYVKGRSDDVFKVNGKKVSALLIAKELMDTNYFRDAAVIAVNVDMFGKVPIAFCVVADNVEFNKGKVLKNLRTRLTSNHLPHQFILLNEIPRTGSGKIMRDVLRKLVER